ncbi:oocyte zinc finger protein XlCOF19-like [Leucoraja erinacea]|uniref:oocyte zinc finger protein XlCOF19-like n=1 Tax=Leucoraja erinaceus TaxID=7782 RepID=UPI002456EC79|nr:oocyte zinc finger protein XlCOF19-like [Leucoraja erinacea]
MMKHQKIHCQVHTGEKPHGCSTCGKSFADSLGLQLHQRVHSSERPFTCSNCGKRYKSSSNLKNHRRMHTRGEALHLQRLRHGFHPLHPSAVHQQVHSGERPFGCSDCSKYFKRTEDLKIHWRVHPIWLLHLRQELCQVNGAMTTPAGA